MSLTRISQRLLVLPGIACLAVLTGCATSNPCAGNMEYLNARERPSLQLPEGVTGSERLRGGTAMVIPPVAPDPETLDPPPQCLDQPPPYAVPKKAPATAPTGEALRPAPSISE
jgi:hypothetical protein